MDSNEVDESPALPTDSHGAGGSSTGYQNPMKKIDRLNRAIPPANGMEVVTNIPDYYTLLELDRSATHQEIGNAYRYFVKRCHPVMHQHKDATTRDRNSHLFALYNEAYEVLGNAKSRAVYDFYGGKSARNGMLHETFDYRKGAYNKENSEKPDMCFRNYNYDQSVVPKILRQTTLLKNLLASRNADLNYAVVSPVLQKVHLTLEELYNGGIKTIDNPRRVMNTLSAGLVLSDQSLELKIVPGWTNGTRLRYSKMAPIIMCAKPSDLILEIVLDPHPRFRVDKYDIYTTIQIQLAEVMGTGPINMQHLDGRNISISLTELASPNTAKLIPSEGLAKDELKKNFGNLYVDFDIIFPEEIDPWQKLELWVALVEYPRPRPPLHYAIAPISATSLQNSGARQILFDLPKVPSSVGSFFLDVAADDEALAVGPSDQAYRTQLEEQFREDADFNKYKPVGLQMLGEAGQVGQEDLMEAEEDGNENFGEEYVEEGGEAEDLGGEDLAGEAE